METKIMTGKIIYYIYDDAEFGKRFVVDNVVITSDEMLEERMTEIRNKCKNNVYCTLREISTQTVTIL